MTAWIFGLLISALVFFIGAKVLPGVHMKNFKTAIIVALVVALLNFLLGFILKVVTLGLLSLSILSFVLNAILIYIADIFIKDFKLDSFWWALALGLLIALGNTVAGSLLGLE